LQNFFGRWRFLRGGEGQRQKQPQILRSAYPTHDKTVRGAPKRYAQDDTLNFVEERAERQRRGSRSGGRGWQTGALFCCGVALEVNFDAVCGPCGDAYTEKVCVFGPDGAVEGQGCGEDRHVV
jgi:hypothetical protein